MAVRHSSLALMDHKQVVAGGSKPHDRFRRQTALQQLLLLSLPPPSLSAATARR